MVVEVDTDVLVRYATRRYEETYAYHGVYNYILDVAAAPRWAWSTLPWSDEWRRGWEASGSNRADEAAEIRNVMAATGGNLLKVAADYTDTELEIALAFRRIDPNTGEQLPLLQNEDTSVYLDHYQDGVDEVTVAPGGPPPRPAFRPRPKPSPTYEDGSPIFPDHTPRPPSGVPYPADHARLQSLLNEEKPAGWTTWMGEGSAGYTYSTQEIDALQRFVEKAGQELMVIEKEAVALDPGTARPWADMIEPAWLSHPSIIENRADLMESVANTYAELHDELDTDTGWLRLRWGGIAAEAYFVHANTLMTYLERLRDKAQLLATEGKQAAEVLRQLRLAYADVGKKRIDDVRNAYQEHIAATTSSIGRVASCTDPHQAAQALIEELGAYHLEMWEIRQPKLEEAQELLIPEQVAAAAAPDFGAGHDVAVLPRGLGGYDTWNDGTSWRPNGSGAAAAPR